MKLSQGLLDRDPLPILCKRAFQMKRRKREYERTSQFLDLISILSASLSKRKLKKILINK